MQLSCMTTRPLRVSSPFGLSILHETPAFYGHKPKLLEVVCQEMRRRNYSLKTEKSYAAWIRRFIVFHGKRHPSELGEAEITLFLTHLAVEDRVSASTQNQALSALLFLYREVLRKELDWLDGIVRAKRPVHLPVVLSREEVAAVLRELRGTELIMAGLLYGAGLRLLECCRLRVKDLDFESREITVKYPRAPWEWGWQWLFPATRFYVDRVTGRRRRHHLHESVVQKAVHEAVRRAGIAKPASCHSLRHSFATHLLGDGYDIRAQRYRLAPLQDGSPVVAPDPG